MTSAPGIAAASAPASTSAPRSASASAHLGIAEAGKIAALAGDHVQALRHYREALHRVQAEAAPEVFFRHYTQCVLESLERTGAFDEIVEYCEGADAHYRSFPHLTGFQRRDHGALLERLGAVQVKAGRPEDALRTLTRALETAGDPALPLARDLLDWLRRGLHVDARRLTALQDRHHYFSVRPDQVDPSIATALPASLP